MHSVPPSTETVLQQVDSLGPPGTPVTITEIAAVFDCTVGRLYTTLERLVSHRILNMKQVGSHRQVWWRPAGRQSGGSPAAHDGFRVEHPTVLERISDRVYELDEQCRFTYVNDHAERLLGIDESTVRGHDIRETIELTDTFETLLRQAVDTNEPVFFEDYYDPLGEWFDNAIYPSETGVSVFFRDISERKRLEQELRTEAEHFQVALRNSPVVAFRLDTDLRYTWVGNPQREFAADDILGKRDDELLPAEDAAAVMAPKRTALETGEGVREEVRLDLPGGETIYDLAIEPLFDGTGEISGLTATAVDLTEPTRTKAALQRSEEQLGIALQAADVGTWELDLRTEESPTRSPGHDRIFGYEEPIDDWSFKLFLDHVHPDDRTAVKRSFDDAFETGSWKFDCRITRADGLQRWICAEGGFHMDATGEPVHAVGVVQDITDRQTRQQQLRESEQRYRTLVENFPNGGVALLDDELHHTIVDGQGFELLGLDATALRGNRIADVVSDEIAERIESQYRATLDGESRTFEIAVRGRICEFRTIPLRNTDGVFAILSIFHNITLRKKRQEQALTTLDRLHETVQDIAHLIIESTTQADIEQVVCDRFDATDGYLAAWIGKLDHSGRTVTPSTVGGRAVDHSELSIGVADDDLTVAGAIATAVETATAQRIHTSPTDPVYAQRSEPTPIVHRPGVAVPIRYEAHVYGVVVVYSDRPEGFDQRELDILERLGTIIGHAINSIERKRALIADRATEVVVRSDAVAQPFIEESNGDTVRVSIDQTLSVGGERSLVYYTISGIDPDRFVQIIQQLAPDSELRVLDAVGPKSRLELSTDAETIHSAIATHGGKISAAVLRDGEFTITIQIPHGTDVRPVLDAARTVYPDLRLVSQTTVTLSERTPADAFATLDEQLTDRQREVLEVGYYAGFFEWPRETSGDELAELMGVTPATVHHHLRHGQQKLLASFFDQTSH